MESNQTESNQYGLKEMVLNNKKLLESNGEAFLKVFKVPLHRFMHPIFGFDVVKFNEFINPKEGVSTYQAIEDKYGKEAADLVKRLI